ncbi:hypothetical protein BJ912DRAFT_926610 [Pholiota molesta]|nr:hypothetical protein BJ912DRAFT_926610 [Pholiota molesta]
MPFIEVISFIASDDLHEDLAREDSPLRQLSACEGCLDFVQGRQIEDMHRAYFIGTWKTYEVYDQAARGTSYASFMAYLVQHTISDASVQHFEVDGDPHRALTAPVTEIVFLKSKEADWRWNQELCVGISGAQRGLYFVEGGHPPLRWGETKDGTGRYFMLVGWDSVEVPINFCTELTFDANPLFGSRHTSVQPKKNLSKNMSNIFDTLHPSLMLGI